MIPNKNTFIVHYVIQKAPLEFCVKYLQKCT